MLTSNGVKINDFSPELRAMLEKKVADLEKIGGKIKFKFNIAQKNPEYNFQGAQNGEGDEMEIIQAVGPKTVFPSYWTLQPVTFYIVDPGDKKKKRAGIVIEEDEKGNAIGFKRIVLTERDRGVKTLRFENPDDRDEIGLILLHPALKGGLFHDEKQYGNLIELVNETADAKKRTARRSDKADAMYVASRMDDKEIKDFACAMGWDEDEDISVLGDRIGEMAESDPEGFAKTMKHDHFQYRAAITRAEKAGEIIWIPLENKYTWSNGQTIAAFGKQDDLDRLKSLSEFLMTHKEGDAMFKRIKALTRGKREEKPVEA